MTLNSCNRRGQSTVETLLLLPLFLFVVFGLLQMGQLATALLVNQYAAASIARQMVLDNTTSAGGYDGKFKKLMVAGMRFNGLYADPTSGMLANVTVHACSELTPFPFVAEFLRRPLSKYSGGCGSGDTIGPFSMNGRRFIIHSKATSRMNYRP